MNKNRIILLFILLSIFLLSSNSYAAPQWYRCSIYSIGPGQDTIMVYLTDTATTPAFTQKWFRTDPSSTITNKLFATMLTAASSNFTIMVYTDINVGQYPIIEVIYLNPE